MTGLWTPDGESVTSKTPSRSTMASNSDPGSSRSGTEINLDDIDPDEAMAMAAEMAEVRAKLAQVPAAQVVANHAMGLFELAAIHLQQPTPLFAEAALAIDAMGAIVEGLGPERLDDMGPTLVDALQQIRLAFVQIKASHST